MTIASSAMGMSLVTILVANAPRRAPTNVASVVLEVALSEIAARSLAQRSGDC